MVTRIEPVPTEQARSERRVTFDLPPRQRRRSVSHSRRTVYSRPESTESSRAHEHPPASSMRSRNEQVIKMLKELYSFVDFNTIKRMVETTATNM